MWILNAENGEKSYRLLPGQVYSVGRKGCRININDNTVSKHHANLTVHSATMDGERPKLILVDISKCGCCVNKVSVTPKQETELKDGDIVWFGRHQSKFNLHYKRLVVCTSTMKHAETKKTLVDLIDKFGGKTSNEWTEDCSLLVMGKLVFTIKVVCALASGCHIVTTAYIKTLLDTLEKSPEAKDPDSQLFLPSLDQSIKKNDVALFRQNLNRQKLFEGKIFVSVCSQQIDRLQQAIKLAKGDSLISNMSNNKVVCGIRDELMIILAPERKDLSKMTQSQIKWKEQLVSILKRNNQRMITESEIGLAIFHSSLQTFCNPKAAAVSAHPSYFRSTLSQLFSQSTQSHVPETQEESCTSSVYDMTQPLRLKRKSSAIEKSQDMNASVSSENNEILANDTIFQAPKRRFTVPEGAPESVPDSMPQDSFPISQTPENVRSLRKRKLIDDSQIHDIPSTLPETDTSFSQEFNIENNQQNTECMNKIAVSSQNEQISKKICDETEVADDAIKTTNAIKVASPLKDIIDDYDNDLDFVDWGDDLAIDNKKNDSVDETPKTIPKVTNTADKFNGWLSRDAVVEKDVTPTKPNITANEKLKEIPRHIKEDCKETVREEVFDIPFDDNKTVVKRDVNYLPNGFISVSNKVVFNDKMESDDANYMIIKKVPLIVRSSQKSQSISTDLNQSQGKNFKKFTKVLGVSALRNGIPRIIGGKDLKPFISDTTAKLDMLNVLEQEYDKECDESRMVDRLFDWGKEPTGRKRKR